MRLEDRVVKLEMKKSNALPIWDIIILNDERPTQEAQARIDAFHAMGHSVISYGIIEPSGLPTGQRHAN